MRKLLACAAGAGATLGVLLAPVSAQAATSHASPLRGPGVSTTTAPTGGGDPDTTVMFTVTVGALTMTAPASANLGSGGPGTTISGKLGTVDGRQPGPAVRVLDRRGLGHQLRHRYRDGQ